MKNLKKICVVGHFAFGKNFLDGQTVKIKELTKEFDRQLGEEAVIKIDTHGGIKKIPILVCKTLLGFSGAKNVIMLPAQNGVKMFGPLFALYNKLFKRKIHYIVIGGWLPQFLLDKKQLTKKLKLFDGIYVETYSMKDALEKQGFTNVYVMPNCKRLSVIFQEDLIYSQSSPYKLCTFSRVMKEKGIEDAVNAIIKVNTELGYEAYSLDIYGQIDPCQVEWFDNLCKSFPQYIRYGGLVPFDKSVEVLKEYFSLLFPTYYEGEGFAGTLIDAYSAGVPVIATDWRYNAELINQNTGYVYPTGDQQAFIDILHKIVSNPKMITDKKQLCLKEAEKYKIDKVVGDFLNKYIG